MKSIFTIFLSFTSLFVFSQEVMPEVWAKITAEGKADVLLVLESQLEQHTLLVDGNKFSKNAHVYHRLLEHAKTTQKKLSLFLDKNHIEYSAFYIINMIRLEADASLFDQLLAFDEIGSIHLNEMVRLDYDDLGSRVDFRSIEWGIQNIKADQVWDSLGIKGKGVVVGGQDTGYEWDHPALIEAYRGYEDSTVAHDYNWHDAIDSVHELNNGENPCGYMLSSPCDDNNHGTHTMGTMVGDDGAGNQIGLAPEAKWIGCRNMERGYGTMASYIECFEWFIAPYAFGESASDGDPFLAPHVIANSWSCPEMEGCNPNNFSIMETVVNNVKAAGIVVVVSAGNSGSDCGTVQTPAAIYEASFTVGASNQNDNIARFSSRGPVSVDGSLRPKPNVCAPGVNVRSSIRNGGYRSLNGTSMAGPHVAGAVALMISAVPSLAGQVDTIESILEQTARPKSAVKLCEEDSLSQIPNHTFGHGIIDVYAAVKQAQKSFPLQWISIHGEWINNVQFVRWTTSNEINDGYFEVEMSADGTDWNKFTELKATGSLWGTADYSIYNQAYYHTRTFYRIKYIDSLDNTIYSPTILLEFRKDQSLFSIFPNPNHGQFLIILPRQALEMQSQLEIYNAVGQMVESTHVESIEMNFSLPSGMYFIKLKNELTRHIIRKVIVH